MNVKSNAVDGSILVSGFPVPVNNQFVFLTNQSYRVKINSSGQLVITGTPVSGWVQTTGVYLTHQ